MDIFIKAHDVRKARLPSFRSQPRFLLYLIKSDLHAFLAAVNIVSVMKSSLRNQKFNVGDADVVRVAFISRYLLLEALI